MNNKNKFNPEMYLLLLNEIYKNEKYREMFRKSEKEFYSYILMHKQDFNTILNNISYSKHISLFYISIISFCVSLLLGVIFSISIFKFFAVCFFIMFSLKLLLKNEERNRLISVLEYNIKSTN